MLSKQVQDANDVAVAAQAGRDVTVKFGLEFDEVKELTQLFLDKYLPALREEAATIARVNAAAFLDEFSEKLKESGTVTHEAFAQPDAQACFSRALQDSAIKGHKIDLGFLAEMVVKRLESTDDELLTLVYEQALQVLPKLSASQIAFLAWVHYMKGVRHSSAQGMAELNVWAEQVQRVCLPGLDLSEANKNYLESLGLISVNLVSDANNIMTNMKNNYPFYPTDLNDLKIQAPALHKLIDAYGERLIPTVSLSASGKLIGIFALKTVFPGIDPQVWIK